MPWYGFTIYGTPDIPEPESPVLTGQVVMYITTDVPAGYLRCDGAAVLITDYQDLFNYFTAAGVSFGAAPAGQFRVPNQTDRFTRGLPNAGTIGATGGSLTHNHASSITHAHNTGDHPHQIPIHQHTVPSHTHTYESHAHAKGALTAAAEPSAYQLEKTTLDIEVAWKDHGHGFLGVSGGASAVSTGPRDGGNNNKTSTNSGFAGGTYPITSGTADSAVGTNSVAADLGLDTHSPPKFAVYYLIKT